jgi:hypothetical protein
MWDGRCAICKHLFLGPAVVPSAPLSTSRLPIPLDSLLATDKRAQALIHSRIHGGKAYPEPTEAEKQRMLDAVADKARENLTALVNAKPREAGAPFWEADGLWRAYCCDWFGRAEAHVPTWRCPGCQQELRRPPARVTCSKCTLILDPGSDCPRCADMKAHANGGDCGVWYILDPEKAMQADIGALAFELFVDANIVEIQRRAEFPGIFGGSLPEKVARAARIAWDRDEFGDRKKHEAAAKRIVARRGKP